MNPLDGVRVLDFGRYIAGPYCAALLGELGADVIRVEKLGGSEDRYLGPVAAGGEGALFLQCNVGKRSLTLEPSAPEGREVVRRLVDRADVVVVNLPPPSLRSLGLDYDSLVVRKPDIVLTSITAFGPKGPWSDRVGFDGVAQAMSGSMYLTGEPHEPMKSSVHFADFTTAISAALGTVAALHERQRTGRGRQVDCSLLGSALALANNALLEQATLRANRVASKNRSQYSAPNDAFQTRDGWIAVQAVGNPIFARWARLVGAEDWLEDPRFGTDMSRGDHGALVSERMAQWCKTRSTAEALEALERAHIPAGPVYSPDQALSDGHITAAGFFEAVDYPGLAIAAPVARAPIGLGGTSPRRRPPQVGEHTEEILRDLGYSADDLEHLRARGVV